MNINNFLENFSKYKGKLGSCDVEKSIEGWVNNFKYLNFNNMDILYVLLNNIKFVYDNEIINTFNNYLISENISYNDNIIIEYFGIKKESSYRIINKFKNMKKTENIHEILKKVNDKSVLFFIDDFLVSGGQFISIIKSFFSKNKNRQELNLSENEINIFRKVNKVFFFYKGTKNGLKKANKILKYYKLNKNSKVKIINKFSTDITLFGKISNNKIYDIKNTLFSNYATETEIKNFYNILKNVGIQLLRQNKPHWTKQRINNSFLGYANNGQLIFGEYNVPTCTLTSLWMGGNIIINGKIFKWQPLVFRKEKNLAQTEHI